MRWMWIDTIVAFEPDKAMSALKNVSLAEEHLHDHFAASDDHDAQPVMPASLMIEGMAQTAGVLVGSVNRFREKVILAKIVKAQIDCDVTPGDQIRYDATIERIDAGGASTSGVIMHRPSGSDDWSEIGRVDLMFAHADNNMAGVAFPEHNFVFSDNFKLILEAAGLAHLAD